MADVIPQVTPSTIPVTENIYPVTPIATPSAIPVKKKGIPFGIIILIFLGILSVGSSMYLYLTMFRKSTHGALVYIPTLLPAGFTRIVGVQTTSQGSNRIYITEYKNASDGDFVLSQEDNGQAVCTTPAKGSDVFIDYRSFLPTGAQFGCALTFVKKTDGTKTRSYLWQFNTTKFILLVKNNLSITDSEALQVANSLQQQNIK